MSKIKKSKSYTFPEPNTAFEKIIEYFSFLTKEYDYKIISKDIKEYFVEIIYENINRIIVISNQTNYTDYGFSVFIYNTEEYNKNKNAINILNKPFEEQDKECIFIKTASEYLYLNYIDLINDSKKKIIRIK
jgi:hypothetical protein